MNTFKGRWPQFKQELSALIYLAIVQTWLYFNLPVFIRLGSPLSVIVAAMASVISMVIYLYVFLFPENYAPLINVEFLDDFPEPALAKNIFRGMMLIVFHVTCLYAWYGGYHGMSNAWYAISYVHCVISFILIYKTAERYNNKRWCEP